MEKSQAKADNLQTPDSGDSDPACLAIEVVAHVRLVKHGDSGLVHVAGNVPVGVLDSELILLPTDTDKSLTSLED